MKKTTLAAVIGSGVLAVFLAFVLALPAAARPWSGHMWDGSQDDPITIGEVQELVAEYLEEIDQPDLVVGEVMRFDNHFYAAVVDEETGNGAFEVLISLDGRSVHPEPGPNMMWNAEYSPMFGENADMHRGMGPGMMDGMYGSVHGDASMGSMHGGRTFTDMHARMGSGMMGNMHGSMGAMHRGMGSSMMGSGMMGSGDYADGTGYPSGTAEELDVPLTQETVTTYVQDWLDDERPGVTASEPIAFPGYFTLHTERDGEIVGMLSVHIDTGDVWEHTWHGEFVAIEHGDHE